MTDTARQKPKLYGYFRSSSSYRCRIAFNLKGMAYDFEPVHLKSGAQKSADFAALNPQQMLPVLITPVGAQLTQSLAILEWLDECQPDPPLLPTDLTLRAQERGFAMVIACDIHPLQNLRVLDYLRAELAANDAQVGDWLKRWITHGLTACEELLAKRAAQTPYCFGKTPGLADICLVPQVFSAQRFGVDISHLKRVNEIHQRCETLPAFATAHPSKQPDFEA